jgi:diguanylate cyclase (GGDEF)-like protein
VDEVGGERMGTNISTQKDIEVNPVRNSSRCDSKSSGALNPALRGGTPYGAEPGIILKSNPAAAAGPEGLWARREQRGIISNGVNGRQKALFLQSTVHTERPTGGPNCKKAKILIVDDEEDLCEILAQVLRENGYLADMTFTVSEAIEKIRNTRYELMITDMRLPDRSGIELLERAKKISPHTAVIILTAFPETETAVTALNNGAFSYLTKPFSNKGLLSVVGAAFTKQNAFLRQMQLLERLRRKNTKLAKLSITDKLTGLYNRAYLEEILAREEIRSQRYRRPIAILMVDIDDLKYINDHFGHLKGDLVVKETAKLLQNTCRASDIVARYGGDEFVILLPETTEKGASSVTASLRKAVNEWNAHNSDQGLTLNLAFGYACRQDGISLIDVLNQADANMYEDKIRHKTLLISGKENRERSNSSLQCS